MVVFKYEVPIKAPGLFDLFVSKGATVLCVKNQHRPGEQETTVIYTMGDPVLGLERVRFYLAWTGVELPESIHKFPYIGTYDQIRNGALVYHLFGGIPPEKVAM